MCDGEVFGDELCVCVSVRGNLLSLGCLSLALGLTGLEGRLLLITLQVAQEATEDIGDTTGTSCALGVGSLGLTASNGTTSETTNRLLEYVNRLKFDVTWRTYPSRSWVIWSPPAAWAPASWALAPWAAAASCAAAAFAFLPFFPPAAAVALLAAAAVVR